MTICNIKGFTEDELLATNMPLIQPKVNLEKGLVAKCKFCGKQFTKKRGNQKTCGSPKCIKLLRLERTRRKSKEAKEQHLCLQCLKSPQTEGVLCSKCAEKSRARQLEKQKRVIRRDYIIMTTIETLEHVLHLLSLLEGETRETESNKIVTKAYEEVFGAIKDLQED